ncbi:MAG: SUMF1/EgtB/PvdO family nonheme iron enzyme [Flavobacteriales bacterium]|nr:SUMF1/EgtB/PvdO family nonheme iron enzyme [Flavobacteriales bacterium]MCB9449444.1 SUMF1/EgtB/PvdO family nonheme iron enzyme [Flavobacteriales bacterium]
MKRLLHHAPWIVLAFLAGGCGGYYDNGELTGVLGRPKWYMDDPYGTIYIPMGSYNMGPSDQEVPYAQTAHSKTVSVQAYYMDDTEISNNEYRQFVYWVRDSIAGKILGEDDPDTYLKTVDEWEMDLDPPTLNWRALRTIPWDDKDIRQNGTLDELFYPENERFYRRREIDTRKLNFEYWVIDYRNAARKVNRYEFTDENNSNWKYGNGIKDRSDFITRDVINVYPDTLSWVHDFTYSFNEPLTVMYFWHVAYDDYPVVGINWHQAKAFCVWRTHLFNNYRAYRLGVPLVNDFRLPTEAEWEYGSRGGLDLSPFPWGGPYIRNSRGCFLGNFKPMRGNYIDDGGFHTVKVTSYWPNEYGLWCMAGNVSEWCEDAFDESAYNFAHDLNPYFFYNAKETDPPALKRKVVRGGSWTGVGYYMQTGTRDYEYQDSSKCYVGFRCVMTFLGRAKEDFQ